MVYGELSSLFQLAVGLNLGFGAVSMFVEPARRRFEASLSAIESRLLELSNAAAQVERGDQRIGELYQLNKSYLRLLADTKLLSVESYIWLSLPTRLVFMVGALVAFVGLVLASWWAQDSVGVHTLGVAVAVNVVPMAAAVLLFFLACWYQYKIFPRVEKLQEQLFGRRSLVSARI